MCVLDIGQAVRVFANRPGDLGSFPGRIIPKTQKMVLDASLLNTQHFKVRIKGKVEQSRERSRALPYTLVEQAIGKGTFGSPTTMVANLLSIKVPIRKKSGNLFNVANLLYELQDLRFLLSNEWIAILFILVMLCVEPAKCINIYIYIYIYIYLCMCVCVYVLLAYFF